MNWEAIGIGVLGVAVCAVFALVALIWGGQGDGYHGAYQRDAGQTAGCLAIVAVIVALFIIGFVIEAQS